MFRKSGGQKKLDQYFLPPYGVRPSDQYFLALYNVRRLLLILRIALQCLPPLINTSYRLTISVASDQYFLALYNACRL